MCVCWCVWHVACGMPLRQGTLHLYDNEHVKIAQNQSLRTKNHCKLLRMPLDAPAVSVPLSQPCVSHCPVDCASFRDLQQPNWTSVKGLCTPQAGDKLPAPLLHEGQFRVMMKYDPNGLRN